MASGPRALRDCCRNELPSRLMEARRPPNDSASVSGEYGSGAISGLGSNSPCRASPQLPLTLGRHTRTACLQLSQPCGMFGSLTKSAGGSGVVLLVILVSMRDALSEHGRAEDRFPPWPARECRFGLQFVAETRHIQGDSELRVPF